MFVVSRVARRGVQRSRASGNTGGSVLKPRVSFGIRLCLGDSIFIS